MSVGRKKLSVCQDNVAAFSCCCKESNVIIMIPSYVTSKISLIVNSQNIVFHLCAIQRQRKDGTSSFAEDMCKQRTYNGQAYTAPLSSMLACRETPKYRERRMWGGLGGSPKLQISLIFDGRGVCGVFQENRSFIPTHQIFLILIEVVNAKRHHCVFPKIAH